MEKLKYVVQLYSNELHARTKTKSSANKGIEATFTHVEANNFSSPELATPHDEWSECMKLMKQLFSSVI